MREPKREFASLLSALVDGSIDAAGNERLCELMQLDPALQDQYLDILRLHGLLYWRAGRAVQPPRTSRVENEVNRPNADVEEIPERLPQFSQVSRIQRWKFQAVRAVAMLCLGMGVGFILNMSLAPSQREEKLLESLDVVEELVGWNLDIAQAQTHEERQKLYENQADSMRNLLSESSLSGEDKDLARTLVETGAWLASNDDPMAEAERFGEIADKLLARIDSASAARDKPRLNQFANAYRQLTEVGVSENLKRAIAANAHDPKHKRKLDHLIAGDDGRVKKLEEMLQRQSESNSKAIHRALKGHRHKFNPAPKPNS